MVAQAFFYNAIFFTYALVLTDFYAVRVDHVGWYLLPFAAEMCLGLSCSAASLTDRSTTNDHEDLCGFWRATCDKRRRFAIGVLSAVGRRSRGW